MRFRRALTPVLGVALLGFPAFVAGAGTASAAESYNTTLTIATTYSKMPYKTSFQVGGTITATDATGAEQSIDEPQTVTLERQDAGSSTWTVVATDDIYSSYYFTDFVATKNATYRISFAGGTQHNYDTGSDDTLMPSTASASIKVSRTLGDKMVQKSSQSPIYLRGNVNPGWGNKVIHLQKRDCAKCRWHNVDKKSTSATGAWSFRLGAPRTGKWYWRTYVGATTEYIKSWSEYSYYTYRY